jgi:hypothetical protein
MAALPHVLQQWPRAAAAAELLSRLCGYDDEIKLLWNPANDEPLT